jgi:hypothetical protein
MRGELDFSPAEKWVVPKLGFSPGDPQASAKAQIYRDADVARLESLAPPTESRGLPQGRQKGAGFHQGDVKKSGASTKSGACCKAANSVPASTNADLKKSGSSTKTKLTMNS